MDVDGPHLHIDLSLHLPCAVFTSAGKGRRWSTVNCRSHRHTTSVAQESGTTTGGTWTGDGKSRQAAPMVGLRRRNACTPDRSGLDSHRPEQHVCPHTVTREPSSSWTARTSQQCAFQQVMATSDLGGTRRKKAGTIWQSTWR